MSRDPRLGFAPPRPDGRNVDPEVGTLLGEGAEQRVRELRAPAPPQVSMASADDPGPSYYGLPLLKTPVWRWEVPLYFYVGGVAGASAVLGAAAQALGGRSARPLVERCRWVGTAGAAVSAALLVRDLGRPNRFLNMLRVFRPSSPMNMGSWLLTAFGALSSAAAAPTVIALPLAARRAADLAGYGAGLLGLPLVGYTGVLLANTAVPIWQGGRRSLPVLFAFSGAASAGALFELWRPPGAGAAMARRLGLVSTAAELAGTVALEREVSIVPRVARPLRGGRSGLLFRAGQLLALASLAVGLTAPRGWVRRVLHPGVKPRLHAASGILGTAATLAIRFGIVEAGKASARDPHAAFVQQRAGHGARDVASRRSAGRMPAPPGAQPAGKESFEHEQLT